MARVGFSALNAFDHAPLPVKLLAFRSFHRFGAPRLLPINLTVSVTYTCPSRCKTCDIWQKKVPDFTLEEYEKTFRSMEGVPIWVTVSGGDQFVRSDLPELFGLIRRILRPRIINLPMNGLITKQIEKQMPGIVEATKGSKLIVNLSLDDIGTRHDEIRGARDNWEKMMKARDLMLDLQKSNPHVTVGIHTVISSHNVERIPEIHAELKKLRARLVHHRGRREARRARDDREGHHAVRPCVRRCCGLPHRGDAQEPPPPSRWAASSRASGSSTTSS